MVFDISRFQDTSNPAQAILGGIESGQNIRAKQYALGQTAQMQGLQQAYLGATDDKQKQGILQQMAVYSPEHAKGIASISQLGVNPFEGTSMEAQKANLQYQRYIAAGYPAGEARIKAINDAASVNAQYYTDPMGNRVTMGGIPLPDVGQMGGQAPAAQPMLGGNQPTPQAAGAQPMLGAAPIKTQDRIESGAPQQDITDEMLASATPEERQFAIDFAQIPVEQRKAFYTQQAAAHPDLPPELTPDVEMGLINIGNKLSTQTALPQIDRSVSPSDMASPLARKERMMQEVGKETLQNPTSAKIEEKLLNSTEALSRVKSIQTSFKPEYLQLGTRLGAATSSMKDFIGVKLSPEETAQLSDYTGFKRASVDNMNRLLNELSGAAVSPAEGKRIEASQPSAGTGVFDGDSPVVFKRKMDDVTKQMQHATLRYNYALRNGMNPLKTGIALEDIPQLIEKRGSEIEKQIKKSNPSLQQDAIDMQTKLQLGQEFGMQ